MASGSNFFVVLQSAFLLSVQLGLSKLGDPARVGKFENMTLAKLIEEIRELDQVPSLPVAKFYDRLDSRLQEFILESAHLRNRRNKRFAHTDYKSAKNLHQTPIPGPTQEEIEVALDSLNTFMGEIEEHYSEPPTSYGSVIITGDGEEVLSWLKLGQRYEEKKRAGEINWTDLQASQWFDVR